MKTTRPRAAAAALTLAFALGAPARADVDVEVANGDRVQGSITTAGADEVIRVRVPQDAALTVVVAGKRRSRREPARAVTLRILDEQDGEPFASQITPRGKGARLRRAAVPATGEYRLLVRAAEAGGDYQLRVAWKQKTRIPFSADTTVDPLPEPTFGADAGSTVTVTIRAPRKSEALPRLDAVRGLGSGFEHVFTPLDDSLARSQKDAAGLTRTDTFRLTTGVVPGADGPVAGVIRIRPDRTRSRLRLTTSRLAAQGTANAVLARGIVVGPEGATVDFGSVAGGAVIEGATVEIPENALTAPIPILIGSSTDVAPDADANGAGPSMFCGPSGTRFSIPATVDMPFNPNPFDAALTGLRVVQRDAKGRLTEITTGVVPDGAGGRVAFPVSQFSSFRVVGPPIPQARADDVTGDGRGDLLLAAATASDSPRLLVFAGAFAFFDAAAIDTDAATAAFTDDVNVSASFGLASATGDANGDGTADLVLADPVAGTAYVFFGGGPFVDGVASTADVRIDAGGARAGLGLAVGDVDDDAVADVVLGAPDAVGAAPAGAPGTVYAFGGRVRFDTQMQNVLDLTDRGLRTLTGEADLDEFGTTVALGDVTGDGLADVVVGAPRDAGGRPSQAAGRVYVFPSASSTLDVYAGDRPPPIVLEGAQAEDRFGAALAVGDVNGDGVGDVIVGAPGAATSAAGAVHVFLGGLELAGAVGVAAADHSYAGTAPGDRLGTSVLSADVTGNGFDDVVVGAPGVDLGTGPNANAGAILIFQGGRKKRGLPPSGTAVLATIKVIGVTGGAQFGARLQAVDLDADAAPDLAVAAPFHAETMQTQSDEGRVFVFRGGIGLDVDRSSDADVAITGKPGERLGAPDAERLPQ
jgi:hypothetical protein